MRWLQRWSVTGLLQHQWVVHCLDWPVKGASLYLDELIKARHPCCRRREWVVRWADLDKDAGGDRTGQIAWGIPSEWCDLLFFFYAASETVGTLVQSEKGDE